MVGVSFCQRLFHRQSAVCVMRVCFALFVVLFVASIALRCVALCCVLCLGRSALRCVALRCVALRCFALRMWADDRGWHGGGRRTGWPAGDCCLMHRSVGWSVGGRSVGRWPGCAVIKSVSRAGLQASKCSEVKRKKGKS